MFYGVNAACRDIPAGATGLIVVESGPTQFRVVTVCFATTDRTPGDGTQDRSEVLRKVRASVARLSAQILKSMAKRGWTTKLEAFERK